MRSVQYLVLMLAIGSASLSGCATSTDGHSGHHPAGAAPAAAPPSAHGAGPMDAQMATMRRMHERMASARTAEERGALMADHMKAMHDGMAMMKKMPQGGMMGDMAGRQQMMEKRMDMMSSMIEMMMDRLPPAAAK